MRSIDKIIGYKHFWLIVAILLLFMASREYGTSWFYIDLTLGILAVLFYLYKLMRYSKQINEVTQ